MGILTKTADAAQKDVAKAQAVVEEWTAKAAAVRAEAQQLDADAGAQILADESAAERITVQIQSLERKARAFDQAAAEAGRKLAAAQRDAMDAALREEMDAAAKIRKAAEAHDAKVEALIAKLEELDGCEFERGPVTDITGARVGQQTGKAGEYEFQVRHQDIRVAVIRYYLAEGKLPRDFHDLNNTVGTSFHIMGSGMYEYGDVIPECVRTAQAAGLTFAA